jgi:hypothetical protein
VWNARAARKLDQSAARKVIHLRDVHSTLLLFSAFCLPVAGRRDRPFFRPSTPLGDGRAPLTLAAPLAHPIALALHRDDRRVMGQSVE